MKWNQIPSGWWQDSKGHMRPPGTFLTPPQRSGKSTTATRRGIHPVAWCAVVLVLIVGAVVQGTQGASGLSHDLAGAPGAVIALGALVSSVLFHLSSHFSRSRYFRQGRQPIAPTVILLAITLAVVTIRFATLAK